MRIFKLSSLLFLLFTGVAWAQESQRFRFSLEECVEYALHHNPSVKISDLERNIAKAQVGETRAEGLPQINFEAQLGHNFEPQKMIIDPAEFPGAGGNPGGGGNGPPEEVIISFAVGYDGIGTLSATQLLFDGSYFVGLQAARTYKQLSEKEYVASKIDLVENVTKAYYGALVNQERLELTRSNVGRLDTLLRETRIMYENGFAEKIDVSRIQVQLNNMKTQYQNLHRLQEINYQLLKFQMGMPVAADLELTGSIADLELEEETISPKASFVSSDRIEYQQMEVNRELALLDMRNNRAQYLPKLNAFFNYGYNTATSDFNQLFDFQNRWLSFGTVGLTLSVPIFDGLAKSYRIQQNKIQLEQLTFQKEALENQFELEIEQALTNYQNNTEALEVQRENLELANDIFNVTKIKYQQGVGSNLELVEAENALKEAETNYYTALYDALIARVDLEKAFGTLLKQENN